MDTRIKIIFAALILILSTFLILKIFSNNCEPPVISLVTDHPKVGEVVVFSNKVLSSRKTTWDFGDGDTSGSTIGKHIYQTPKKNLVIATSEDGCESEILTIVVEEVKVHKEVKPIIIFPTIYAGDEFTVSDNTDGVEKWTWFVNGKLDKEGRDWTYTFPKSGMYSVKLSIDGKWVSGDTTYQVKVLFKPYIKREKPEVETGSGHKGEPMPDSDHFVHEFIDISNGLMSKDTSIKKESSNRWKDLIMPEGCESDFKIDIYNAEYKFLEEVQSDFFKRNLIYKQYKIVKDVPKAKIIRASKKDEYCILKIDVIVEK